MSSSFPYSRTHHVPGHSSQPRARVRGIAMARTSDAPRLNTLQFPLKLDKPVKVLVPRPKKCRSQEEKDKEVELLSIQGIESDARQFVKFNILLDEEDEDDLDKLAQAAYAGTFSLLPRLSNTPMNIMAETSLELNKLLEDLGVEDDEEILVTLVPVAGDITIGSIKIVYAPL
ncbi:Polyphenol oxidase A, chloroplastic [Sesamum alatum]|uniref:Polyphenol oxidase A, chloroplastic n=1 Tax=Sesamum alatum TaxID=300844 RepID=A0AAE1YSC9_9LAMI|nr:Polyphenol oxidase A, chloroplastic [Sesamum alatum]